MSPGAHARGIVDWGAGERRRRVLEAELDRIRRSLPELGVQRALLFGSLARGDVRGQSDLDLILIVDTAEPSSAVRCSMPRSSRGSASISSSTRRPNSS